MVAVPPSPRPRTPTQPPPPFTITHAPTDGSGGATAATLTVHLTAAFGAPPGHAAAWAPAHLAVHVDASACTVCVAVAGKESHTLTARLARPALVRADGAAARLDRTHSTLTVTVPGLSGLAALAELESRSRWSGGGWVQDVVPDRTVVVP